MGCGSPQVITPQPVTSAAVEAPKPVVVAEAPIDAPAHRSAEAFVVKVRIKALLKARDLLPADASRELGNEAADAMGLERGILERPDVLDRLGLDPEGFIALESFELDARGRETVTRLRGLRPDATNEELSTAFESAQRKLGGTGWFLTRARLSVRGDALQSMVVHNLENRSARGDEIAPGESVYSVGRAVWHLKKMGGALVVEIATTDHAIERRDVRIAMAELAAWAPSSSTELANDQDFVGRIAPSDLATAGMLLQSQRASGSRDGKDDAPASDDILGLFLRQARALDVMDAPSGKARYEWAQLVVGPSGLTMTSKLNAGIEPFQAGDWSDSGADFSLDDSPLGFSINGSLLYGWKMLPGREGLNPYYGNDIARTASRAGFVAVLLFAGETPFLLARAAMEEAESLGQATLPFMRKWDRLGMVIASEPEKPTKTSGKKAPIEILSPRRRHQEPVYVGVLPANATEENAACALAPQETACDKRDRIKPSGVTRLRNFAVTRKKMQGRWVIMAARQEAMLKAANLKMTVGSRPPLSGWLSPALIPDRDFVGFKTLPKFLGSATADRNAGTFTLTIQPAREP